MSSTRRRGFTLVEHHGDGLAWAVVANRRGRMNAVVYGPEGTRLAGFSFSFDGPS